MFTDKWVWIRNQQQKYSRSLDIQFNNPGTNVQINGIPCAYWKHLVIDINLENKRSRGIPHQNQVPQKLCMQQNIIKQTNSLINYPNLKIKYIFESTRSHSFDCLSITKFIQTCQTKLICQDNYILNGMYPSPNQIQVPHQINMQHQQPYRQAASPFKRMDERPMYNKLTDSNFPLSTSIANTSNTVSPPNLNPGSARNSGIFTTPSNTSFSSNNLTNMSTRQANSRENSLSKQQPVVRNYAAQPSINPVNMMNSNLTITSNYTTTSLANSGSLGNPSHMTNSGVTRVNGSLNNLPQTSSAPQYQPQSNMQFQQLSMKFQELEKKHQNQLIKILQLQKDNKDLNMQLELRNSKIQNQEIELAKLRQEVCRLQTQDAEKEQKVRFIEGQIQHQKKLFADYTRKLERMHQDTEEYQKQVEEAERVSLSKDSRIGHMRAEIVEFKEKLAFYTQEKAEAVQSLARIVSILTSAEIDMQIADEISISKSAQLAEDRLTEFLNLHRESLAQAQSRYHTRIEKSRKAIAELVSAFSQQALELGNDLASLEVLNSRLVSQKEHLSAQLLQSERQISKQKSLQEETAKLRSQVSRYHNQLRTIQGLLSTQNCEGCRNARLLVSSYEQPAKSSDRQDRLKEIVTKTLSTLSI